MSVKRIHKLLLVSLLIASALLTGCGEEDELTIGAPSQPANSLSYELMETNDSRVAGYIRFQEETDGTLTAEVALSSPPDREGTYLVQLHTNSAAEEGSLITTLLEVDAATRQSTSTITELTYDELLSYDGHINVLSGSSGSTVIAQADIGGNALSGNATQYTLSAKSGSGITGTVLLEERINGLTKATINLNDFSGSPAFPSHIHINSAAEEGSIYIDFNPIDGTTGTSVTTIRRLNENVGGTPITYQQLLNFDGYINVHQSAENPIIVSQTDIGVNELTGDSTTYPIAAVAVADIEGTVTFAERKSGETLVTIRLDNTPDDGAFLAYLYTNTVLEGGSAVLDLSPVDGASGISLTNVTMLNNGTPILYEDLIRYDGYVNVYQNEDSPEDLVGQGDIGGNALTEESVTYPLARAGSDIQGEVTFYRRNNGFTLAVVRLENTPPEGIHPTHIHANTAAEGGSAVISLNAVNGASGLSSNNIRQFDDGTPIMYEQLLSFDGYLDVHLDNADASSVVAEGDIGQNALTGNQVEYPLAEIGNSGVSGTVTVAERNNGFSLVTVALNGTSATALHPGHIHFNSAEEGGGVAVWLTPLNGAVGVSNTHVESLSNNLPLTYRELIDFDGYVNLHLSAEALNVIVTQGNIGSNATL